MTVEEYYISFIDLDLYELLQYRKNLKKFFYLKLQKNTLSPREYERFLNELERIITEINNLENRKSEILNSN